jgi:hypothetical protein
MDNYNLGIVEALRKDDIHEKADNGLLPRIARIVEMKMDYPSERSKPGSRPKYHV